MSASRCKQPPPGAAVFKLSDDAASLSPGSFGFWADTLPVINQYFAITVLLAACGFASAAVVSGFANARDDGWRAVMYSAVALGGVWFLFAESVEMWVRAGPFAMAALWTFEGVVLVCFAARRSMVTGAVLGTLLQFACRGRLCRPVS